MQTTQTESDPLYPVNPLPSPPPLPVINIKNNRGPVEEVIGGVAAEIFQSGGMNLLHPGTQEAHFHMHFYIRPITATQQSLFLYKTLQSTNVSDN